MSVCTKVHRPWQLIREVMRGAGTCDDVSMQARNKAELQ